MLDTSETRRGDCLTLAPAGGRWTTIRGPRQEEPDHEAGHHPVAAALLMLILIAAAVQFVVFTR